MIEGANIQVIIEDGTNANLSQQISYIKAGTQEIEDAVTEGLAEFDANATSKTNDFNDNTSAKTLAFNQNADAKTAVYDNNASEKLSAYNENATNKLAAYNANDTAKTEAYNLNATNKTTAFNNNASEKTSTFNDNAIAKTSVFNSNATSKTNDFNSNASSKTTAFNDNYTAKKALIDAEVATAQGAAETATTKAGQASTYADHAKIWAEGLDGEVAPLGGTHSSKGWAEIAEAAASGVQNPANRDLSNLTDAGQLVIDSANGTISNCILDIPQNLKLTIENNVLTLKTGSTLVLTNRDTYTTLTTTQDYTLGTFYSAPRLVFFSGTALSNPSAKVGSGTTLPADNAEFNYFFLISGNTGRYYQWTSNGWVATWSNASYPLCMVYKENGVVKFAKDSEGHDMIFNGAGFVGHHQFIYPSDKGLKSKGYNTDRTLASDLVTTTSLQIIAMETNASGGVCLDSSGNAYLSDANARYDEQANMYYRNSSDTNSYLPLTTYTTDSSNVVTSFSCRQPYEGARNLLTDDLESSNYIVKATGTTTSRALKDRFADIINVKDFGAKGDGVTDDTAALQAALDEQAITGAKIFVPAGQYNVQNLTYKSKLEIFGDGNPTSTIVFTGTSGALLSADTGVNPFGSNISDISFSGSLGTCFVGRTDGSNRGITFENVYINGFTVGIQLSDAFNNAIRDCKISGCGKGILYKSITWGATESVTGDIIENCYFSGNTVAGLCVDSGGAFNTITLINNIFEVNEIGVLSDDSYRITMIGCYFERNVSGGATLRRGIDINCFYHSSNGNNAITYSTGASYTNSQILMKNSGDETFKVYNENGVNKSKITKPDVAGILKMGTMETSNIGHIDCTTATRMNIGVSGNNKVSLLNSAFIPYENDAFNLGSSARMWKEIFCGNGTINTSDERQKRDIEDIAESVFRAWEKVSFKQFVFKEAFAQKGDKARIHFGVIAQKVKEAFESEGLDGFKYGLLCYDEWDDEYEDIEVVDKEAVIDENGEIITPQETHIEQKLVVKAGNAYGIRYTEALALECAYQRWKLEQMQKQLENIKGE